MAILLTKGIAYIYCSAIGFALAVPILLRANWDFPSLAKCVGALSFVVLVALTINAGHLYRNHRLYGHPLSTEGDRYRNQDMSGPLLLSNMMRNAALHVGTPSERLNWYIYRAHQLLLGEQLNNPDTTWGKKSFEIQYGFHEEQQAIQSTFSSRSWPCSWLLL